jgi:uncharacterized protein (TIGR02145 family)
MNLLAQDWNKPYPEDWKDDELNEQLGLGWVVNITKGLTWHESGYIYGIIENSFDYNPDTPTETPWIADEEGTVEDYEGNVYKTLRFGDTWWMAENLRTKTFADGTEMQKYVEWDGSCDGGYNDGNTSEFMYTHANDDPANDAVYGCLYNWWVGYSTLYKKNRLLKEEGWVIPDTLDFYNLMKRFGLWENIVAEEVQHNHDYTWEVKSVSNFGLFLKSDRRTLWETGSPREGEIPYNASGLNFPPAGQMEGTHSGFGTMATIWTGMSVHATPYEGLGRRYYILSNLNNTITTSSKGYGMARSIRLVKRIVRSHNNDGTYTATDNIAWTSGYIDGIMETNPTAITSVNTSTNKTWGAQGNILVQCQTENTQVEIYNISGNLVKQVQLSPGTMQIGIKSGLYIVRVNGVGKKVVVQ